MGDVSSISLPLNPPHFWSLSYLLLLRISSAPTKRSFCSYIHGGAWRDPRKTKSGIQPALSRLLPPAAPATQIAGIASLNYRLSPHPNFPIKPGDEADAAARTARHPQHVNDVIDALRWLKENWGVRDGGYVLVGHSCGGTLAMQVVMSGGRKWSQEDKETREGNGEEGKTPMPRAIVPVEAISDLLALVASHVTEPFYEELTIAAFGREKKVWEVASPVNGTYGLEKGLWRGGRLAVLAHSKEDELVEWEQCNLLLKVLKKQGWKEKGSEKAEDEKSREEPEVVVLELKGKHDEVWERGEQLARAIEFTMQRLAKSA